MGEHWCHWFKSHFTLSNKLTMDIRSKDEFVYFMQRACEDTSNDCYIELYNLLRAFISADADLDGAVSEDEFEGMINAAAAFPQKFGFEFWKGSGKDQFKAIDEMEMELSPSTSGWLSPMNTTRLSLCRWPSTSRTRMGS